jgi:signal transduction histidine kinase
MPQSELTRIPAGQVGRTRSARRHDRAFQLAAALGIAQRISGLLDLEPLLNTTAHAIQSVFDCSYVALLLPEGDLLARRAFAGHRAGAPELGVPLVSSHLASWAFRQLQPCLGGEDGAPLRLASQPGCLIVLPLVAEGRPLGVVEAWRSPAEPWSDVEQEALDQLSRLVAQAITSARRYDQAQRRARDLALLDRVRSSLSGQPSLPDLLHDVVAQTAEALGYPLVSLYMLHGERLVLLHQEGYANLSASLSLDEGVIGRVVRTGEPIRSLSTALLRDQAEAIGVTSSLSVPLRAGSVVVGVLTVESTGARILEQGDQQLLMALADQVAISIEFSHLYETLEARVTHLALVDDISRTVTASLDQNAALEAIVSQVPRAVPCQRLALATYNPDGHTLTIRALWLPNGETQLGVGVSTWVGETEAGVALRTGRLHYVQDLTESRYSLSGQLAAEGLQSAVYVPIMAPEGCLGMLSLSRSEPRAFSAYDRSLLGSLAPHIATAFKNAELYAAAQRAYAELAAAQERNVQAEKMRALGELASGVAHDFNNLLTIILGHIEMMKSPNSPDFERSRRAIVQAAQDGGQTVRRIREFGRAQPEHHTTLVNLAELGDDVLHLTRPRWQTEMQKRGIAIAAQADLQPVPQVLGSAAELREVLTNLILNAVDAMPEGGTLSLSSGVSGRYVWIEVADTGQGSPPEVRERIFEPFYTTKAQRGTGLGLAVSRSIARRHEGDLTVESTPGIGSRFCLSLPMQDMPAASVIPAAELPAPAGPLRILLVEDDQPVRETMARLLQLDRHQVTAFGSPTEALAAFQPGAYDVVCSDLSMPGLSGWELIGQLRERAPELVTVLLSGFGAQIDPAEARAKGADFVVPKPIDIDVLNTALAEAAKRRR